MDPNKKQGYSHSSPPPPPPYPKAGLRPPESLCFSWHSLMGVFLEWPPTPFSGGIGDTTEHTLTPFWGFPSGFPRSLSPACQSRKHWFHPWAVKIPWRKERLLTPVFWPGKSNGLVHGISKSQTLLRDFHTSLHLGHNSGISNHD